MARGRLPLNPPFWDKTARIVITGGGVTLILAVLAILLFILREAAPLAGGAQIDLGQAPIDASDSAIIGGVDEYREVGFLVHHKEIVFHRLEGGAIVARIQAPFGDDEDVVCADYRAQDGILLLGSSRGRAALAQVRFETRWTSSGRLTEPQLRLRGIERLDPHSRPLQQIAGDRDEDGAIALAAVLSDGSLRFAFIDEDETLLTSESLDDDLEGHEPTSLTLSLSAGLLAVGTHDGTLCFWDLADPKTPNFEEHVTASDSPILAMETLLGDESLVVGAEDGEVSVWFRVRYVTAINEGDTSVEVDDVTLKPGAERVLLDRGYGARFSHRPELRFVTAGRPWTRIRKFSTHDRPIVAIAVSPRGKGFASFDAGGRLALHHSTSERTLKELETQVGGLQSLVFSPKADGLVAVEGSGLLHLWRVDNPHPEAGVQALFGNVWYEGYSEAKHVWQTTGGSAEFEPKFGLVPLFLGTLKGTLYAMLFSVPIAILGALYLSQLATTGLRNVIKPVVELMAAIPSVVVGFLAALWLAPLLEENMASVFAALLAIPLGLVAAITIWMLLPQPWRQSAKPGVELLFMLPFLVVAVWLGASMGGVVENSLFAGDLKQWLYDSLGIQYDQRNCIVVGIALGFAVIPIIFSICEDAMSSVPPSLTTAALALGASPWQTAVNVILPAASPGIFAAVMLGLGRAIGETMIVLMATGNTPILDLAAFNGMRTMSAAIAVEIPEAPHGGTLYRILFLTGSLLFLCTFLINTGADLIGRRLRKRYAQF